jgi:uncharacterized protein YbaR (Trm112 family)
MHPWALELLACPRTGSRLRLEGAVEAGDRVVAGTLVSDEGRRYPVVRGVPRLLVDYRNPSERDTVEAFGAEWAMFRAR